MSGSKPWEELTAQEKAAWTARMIAHNFVESMQDREREKEEHRKRQEDFRREYAFWIEVGVSTRTLNVLRNNDCPTAEHVLRLGPKAVSKLPGCGKFTLDEIGRAIGGWPLEPIALPLDQFTTEQLEAELLRRRGE